MRAAAVRGRRVRFRLPYHRMRHNRKCVAVDIVARGWQLGVIDANFCREQQCRNTGKSVGRWGAWRTHSRTQSVLMNNDEYLYKYCTEFLAREVTART